MSNIDGSTNSSFLFNSLRNNKYCFSKILQKYFDGASTPDKHVSDTKNQKLYILQRQKD